MVVNGEKVWVPEQRRDLIEGLRRMGVTKVRGKALSSATKEDLTRVYCRERARAVRQRQHTQNNRKPQTYDQSFAAWSAID